MYVNPKGYKKRFPFRREMGIYFSKITKEDQKIYNDAIKRSFKASSYEDTQSMVLEGEEVIYIGRFVFSKITKSDIDKLVAISGDRELVMVEDGPQTDRYFDLYMIFCSKTSKMI